MHARGTPLPPCMLGLALNAAHVCLLSAFVDGVGAQRVQAEGASHCLIAGLPHTPAQKQGIPSECSQGRHLQCGMKGSGLNVGAFRPVHLGGPRQ
eukprot:366462-Chlamydomonas_euryale.AAC.11